MNKQLLFILFLLLIISSCKDNTETIVVGSSTSDIIGYVKLYDAAGVSMQKNNGIRITAEINGTEQTDTTDINGKFILKKLETGTYNLTFSAINYPTVKRYGVAHTGIGSNFIGVLNISALPDFQITSFLVESQYSGTFKYTGTCSTTATRSAIAFFSATNNVSKDNYVYSQQIFFSNGQIPSTNWGTSSLLNKGFVVGSKVYVIAYPTTSFLNTYYDINTGKIIFPALGEPTQVQEFTIQ